MKKVLDALRRFQFAEAQRQEAGDPVRTWSRVLSPGNRPTLYRGNGSSGCGGATVEGVSISRWRW